MLTSVDWAGVAVLAPANTVGIIEAMTMAPAILKIPEKGILSRGMTIEGSGHI